MTQRKRSSRTAAILADLRAGLRDAEIARRHGVTKQRVNHLRQRSGIPHPPNPPKPVPEPDPHRWREDELAALIAHPTLPATQLAAHLGRTADAVRYQRRRLIACGRLAKQPSRWDPSGSGPGTPLSPDELALVEDRSLTVEEVAQRTGRSPKAIAYQRHQRGIPDPRRWTDTEIETLVALHDRPLAEIAAALGRTRVAVAAKRARLMRAGRITPADARRSS